MKAIAVIFGLLILIFIFKLFDFSLGDEVNVYSLTCWVFQKNGMCASNGWSGNVNTYIVRANAQSVVDKKAEQEGLPINLTGCSVVDRNNWHCSYADHSATFGMANGQFWEEQGTNPPKMFGDAMKQHPANYVSRWQFLDTTSRNCGSAYLLCYAFYNFTL